jgi:hypothetical protein
MDLELLDDTAAVATIVLAAAMLLGLVLAARRR